MEEETLMLLSMKDSKAVANALSNETAQKILSHIAEHKEATESELAEKLKVPPPTIHYNIQQLKKAKLLKSKEFFWSKKGKKMRIFTLAKKYIIISPEKTSVKKLKGILPITIISVIGAGLIHLFQYSRTSTANRMESINPLADQGMMAKTASDAAEQTLNNTTQITQIVQEPNTALWFLAGALFAIILVFITNKIKKN